MSAAATVTVHVALYGSGETGVSVNELPGEALCENACGAPAGHWSVNAPAAADTLSLKLMTMLESTATLVAVFAGVVLFTPGALSPGGTPFAVTDRSSMASPWSFPVWSMSTHRNHTSCPFAMVTGIVADF